MSNQNHPWIQDFASFEAVLCCTHELGQWEPSQTLRAYQTYGFDDASTPGNDLTFRHIDTGVLLLHDGDVVAIQYGDGNLSAALSDLFLVLNALGWQEAEVHHPVETLGALLDDMGKAIPGHMAFDVKAAKGVADAGRTPEETALIERSKTLMHGVAVGHKEVQDFNALALGELESMEPAFNSVAAADTRTSPPTQQSLEVVAASAPVHLNDEPDFGISHAIAGQSLGGANTTIRPHGQVFLDDDDAGPVVPVLGASTHQSSGQPLASGSDDPYAGEDFPFDAPVGAIAHASTEPVAVEERGMLTLALPTAAPKSQPQLAAPTESLPVPDMPIEAPACPVPGNAASQEEVALQRAIRIGRSALSFDLPDAPVLLEQVSLCASQLGATDVVHLWPGLIHQSERWDLISEVDLNAPWFAEVVASELEPQCAVERVWFAAALLHLARQPGRPQLRDMLVGILGGDGAAFSGAIGQAATLKPEARERFVNLVLDRFAGLLLSEEGASFLDVRPADGAEAAEPHEVSTFSVRSLVEAPEPKLYVIHLDATDGPFIAMVVRLLQGVAERYSISTRARTQAQALRQEVEHRETAQREAARIKMLETVQATMAGVMEQLKSAGIAMPT